MRAKPRTKGNGETASKKAKLVSDETRKKLTKSEIEVLSQADRDIALAKINLSNIVMEEEQFKENAAKAKAEWVEKVKIAMSSFQEKINAVGTSHGLGDQLADWQLNVEEMAFVRKTS